MKQLARKERRAPLRSQTLRQKLNKPRAIWLMVPAAAVDQSQSADLLPLLEAGRYRSLMAVILIMWTTSGAPRNSRPRDIHYVDVGTSGGIWGLERGYCMMIGGEPDIVQHSILFSQRWRRGSATSRARRDARNSAAPPNKAICIAGRMAPGISSRWSTTVSNTASWPLMPKDSVF